VLIYHSTKSIRFYKILFLEFSTLSFKKWMTEMANSSACTFFPCFLLDSPDTWNRTNKVWCYMHVILCFVLDLRDHAWNSMKNNRFYKILFLEFSMLSSEKWMTEMASSSACTFFNAFYWTLLNIWNRTRKVWCFDI